VNVWLRGAAALCLHVLMRALMEQDHACTLYKNLSVNEFDHVCFWIGHFCSQQVQKLSLN
jgi:hypothetical protein